MQPAEYGSVQALISYGDEALAERLSSTGSHAKGNSCEKISSERRGDTGEVEQANQPGVEKGRGVIRESSCRVIESFERSGARARVRCARLLGCAGHRRGSPT